MGLFTKKKQDDTPRSDAGDKKAVEKKEAVEIKVEKKEVETKEVKTKESKKEKTASKVKKTAKKAVVKHTEQRPANAYKILLRPIISEKATIGTSQNKYVFEVSSKANKVAIKKAVLDAYGVVPQAVNILNKSGKKVRYGRNFGTTKSVKKAVVTLKKGDSIKLYEGI